MNRHQVIAMSPLLIEPSSERFPARARPHLIALAFCLPSLGIGANSAELGPIIINATRVEKPVDEIPAAVSVVGQDQIQLGAEQLGLDESLSRIPGLYFQNRYNFAQDLRASIRGFGARSSFGIRGIKIIVDGIPETLPDGQGSVDGIDLGSASRITVIRGPASSLYGNASGGAILVDSEKGTARPFVEIRPTLGDYDFEKLQFKAGGETGRLNYLLNLSDTSIDGYRDHSEYENTQLNGRFEYALAGDSSLLLSLHHTDQPLANDPGGLTAAEVEDDPSQARDRNVDLDAGEALEQTRVGLLYKTAAAPGHDIEARIYHSEREFDGRLPVPPFLGSGVIELDRTFVGGGAKYIRQGHIGEKRNRLLLGFDYDNQDDDRRRFDNLLGATGPLRLDQNEQVTALGVYAQNETGLRDDLELTVGLRYDDVEFDVDDDFLADGDDSGKIGFDQASPMIGLSWLRNPGMRYYATISTAFETPTTTELANPAGGGFNPDLESQRSINFEIGLKATRARDRFEAALFHIDVDDELIPFELSGREFFENAGESDRDGLELAYTRRLGETVDVSIAFTYSDFTFSRFTDDNGNVFDGNRIPGIPENLLHLGLSWFGGGGFNARWETIYNGELFADNANDVEIDAYHVSNLRLGYDRFSRDWEFAAFVGVNNLFDESYNSNIRINALGGRYYEPAPERNAFAGITLRRKFPG